MLSAIGGTKRGIVVADKRYARSLTVCKIAPGLITASYDRTIVNAVHRSDGADVSGKINRQICHELKTLTLC